MTFAELVAAALAHLERAAIPYMVTGSIASAYHGEARATRDLDIVYVVRWVEALGLREVWRRVGG